MNTDHLLDAIGDISDKYIDEAHQTRIIKKHRFKPFAIAAAAVLCIAAPLPLGVAAGSENAYIASLLKEKERKGITPEETAVLNNRIEEAQIRLQASEREARRQAEESPYRGPIPWGKVFKWVLIVGLAGGAGYGGYKLIPKLAR